MTNSTTNRPVKSKSPTTRLLALLSYMLVVFVCGGATCARKRTAIPEFNPPPVFASRNPTLNDVIEQVNRSLAINSLSSNSLSITSPEVSYRLSGNFSWERPYNFRLDTKLFSSALGTPLAAGSNAEMFWMQTSRPTPVIYYANHDRFEQQAGPRQFLPISPLWLREAFGIIELDPQGRHEGPKTTAGGRLEVTSYIPSPRGDYRRVISLDPVSGTIMQTRLYDQQGKMIALANMSKHQYYAAINWSLPHEVQVQLIPDMGDEISFTVSIGFFQPNEAPPSRAFEFPDTTGMTAVDLVGLNSGVQPSANHSRSYTTIQPAPVPQPGAQSLTDPNSANRKFTATNAQAVSAPVYRSSSAEARPYGWQENLRR
jgi:hypothetical protein